MNKMPNPGLSVVATAGRRAACSHIGVLVPVEAAIGQKPAATPAIEDPPEDPGDCCRLDA